MIALTIGTFDLLHFNHIKFLKKCKQYTDNLIVGLSSDELVKSYKRDPIITYENRYLNIYNHN